MSGIPFARMTTDNTRAPNATSRVGAILQRNRHIVGPRARFIPCHRCLFVGLWGLRSIEFGADLQYRRRLRRDCQWRDLCWVQ